HAHRVDQDVAVVRGVEIHLAADGGHAHAVAVAANPTDNAIDKVPRLRVLRRAEPEGVHHRDRPRAHGEDVAHDAAHARCRALIGLDETGMVVGFHLEDTDVAVADIDDARVFARTLDDDAPRGGEAPQMRAGGFVRAMLAPHHAEHAELDQVRLAPHERLDLGVFLGAEAVLADDVGVDGGHRSIAPSPILIARLSNSQYKRIFPVLSRRARTKGLELCQRFRIVDAAKRLSTLKSKDPHVIASAITSYWLSTIRTHLLSFDPSPFVRSATCGSSPRSVRARRLRVASINSGSSSIALKNSMVTRRLSITRCVSVAQTLARAEKAPIIVPATAAAVTRSIRSKAPVRPRTHLLSL